MSILGYVSGKSPAVPAVVTSAFPRVPIVAGNLLAFKILFEMLFKINTVLPRGLVDLVRRLSTTIRIHECHILMWNSKVFVCSLCRPCLSSLEHICH